MTFAIPDIEAVRQFLYWEGELLDQWRLEEWLELFEPDLLYWIPVRHGSSDPALEVQHAYDDRQRLTERVERLLGRHAYAQQPRSKLCRLIGNVRVEPHDAAPGELIVASRFHLTELRRGVSDLWAGSLEHVLRPTDTAGRYRIASKKVHLLASEEPIDNLTFLL